MIPRTKWYQTFMNAVKLFVQPSKNTHNEARANLVMFVSYPDGTDRWHL